MTKPFVLFVSSLWPYKNCDGLLRAFAAAQAELGDRQLVVVGPGRDDEYVGDAARARRPSSGIAEDVVWVGGVPLEETVDFYRAADVFVYPSLQRDVRTADPGGDGDCGCPVVTSDTSAMPETAGRARAARRPARPGVHRRRHRRGLRARSGTGCATLGLERAAEFTWAATAERHARGVPRGPRAHAEGAAMRILVTGGAGFIGSHTCDRLRRARARGRRPRRAHGSRCTGTAGPTT